VSDETRRLDFQQRQLGRLHVDPDFWR